MVNNRLFWFRVVCFFILGAGGVLLYQWMKPPSYDAYFFLTPKPNYLNDEVYPVEKPIRLDKKGERIDFLFWSVPQPESKWFYLLPMNRPSPTISLRFVSSDPEYDYRISVLPSGDPYAETTLPPLLRVKVLRINEDLTETLISERDFSQFWGGGDSFKLYELSGKHGQYRISIEVLEGIPKLIDLSSFLHIGLMFIK